MKFLLFIYSKKEKNTNKMSDGRAVYLWIKTRCSYDCTQCLHPVVLYFLYMRSIQPKNIHTIIDWDKSLYAGYRFAQYSHCHFSAQFFAHRWNRDVHTNSRIEDIQSSVDVIITGNTAIVFYSILFYFISFYSLYPSCLHQ